MSRTSTGIGINPGAMRERVIIQTRTTTQDSSGDPLPVWSQFASRRGEIVRTPGKEVFSSTSAERVATVPTLFRLRKLDGVSPAMRLLCRGRIYDIISAIDPTGRGEELLVYTQELVEKTP